MEAVYSHQKAWRKELQEVEVGGSLIFWCSNRLMLRDVWEKVCRISRGLHGYMVDIVTVFLVPEFSGSAKLVEYEDDMPFSNISRKPTCS